MAWYDRNKLLSYNKIYNFLIGVRGGGKSYNSKDWAINDFLKNGNKFIWVRRYKTEMENSQLSNFFADIQEKYPDQKMIVKGKEAYINGKVAGYFIALSTSSKYKSVSYPKVNKIIYDEFIIDKSTFRYLKNEVDIFNDLFETVARKRDNVRALFIGNAVSVVNPYFTYFKIHPDNVKQFTIYDHIAVEFYRNEEFKNEKIKTRFGKMIDGTQYGDYAINNEYLRDNSTFIEKKPETALFLFAIKYKSVYYGFWADYEKGYIFVNTKYDPYSYNLYVITKEDLEPNLLLIKTVSENRQMQRVLYCFQRGLIRFENMSVKNQFYEFIGYFISR